MLRHRFAVVPALAALTLLPNVSHGIVARYFGDTNPSYASSSQFYLQSPGELPFAGVRFADCTASSDGSYLTLGTAPVQGIWLGHANTILGSAPINSWSISGNATGNELTYRTRLSSTTSSEWSAYFFDGTHTASLHIADASTLQFVYAGPGNTSLSGTYTFPAGSSAADFHEYRILLKDGLVGYYVDGLPLFQGTSLFSPNSSLFVFGDGSGSTPTGSGGYVIDYITFNTSPTSVVPEPSALTLFIPATALLLRRTRLS